MQFLLHKRFGYSPRQKECRATFPGAAFSNIARRQVRKPAELVQVEFSFDSPVLFGSMTPIQGPELFIEIDRPPQVRHSRVRPDRLIGAPRDLIALGIIEITDLDVDPRPDFALLGGEVL